MACARALGLTTLPIVCVNVDGYYENFKLMLDRAYEDELIKLKPEQIVYFVPTAEEAVRLIEEAQKDNGGSHLQPKLKKRASTLKRSSFMENPSILNWFRRSSSSFSTDNVKSADTASQGISLSPWVLPFVVGLTIGGLVGARSRSS